MRTVIWKTILPVGESCTVNLPEGAIILCAHEQDKDVCIWYKCNPESPPVPRHLEIVITRYDAPADGIYLGSAFLDALGRADSLVFHIFEVPK